MKACSIWWILVGVFTLFSEVSFAWSYPRKAIPTEAGESICSVSKKLKDVSPWTQEKISALRKTRDEYGSKLLDWQLHFHGNSECGENESILEEIQTSLKEINKELQKLPAKAMRAGALAAKSAGRLDEFITVFSHAQNNSFIDGVNYCMGSRGEPVKRRDLLECFSEGGKLEMGEKNLAKIPEIVSEKNEPNLKAAIENINHSVIDPYVKRRSIDDAHIDCNLIKGNCGGILGVNLSGPLWWGGGILTIGKDFAGDLKGKDSKLVSGEIKDAISDSSNSKAFWTASPYTVAHLKKTLAAFQAFKDAAVAITRKFTEIEKVEKQIESCLSNETMEERHTQPCFKNAARLNAELQATNALLARYQKEKGPLPSEGALVLHESVVKVWYLFVALL